MARATRRVGWGLLGLLMAGCVTRVEQAPQPVAVVGASMVVEQFLAAVNGNDLDTMARLFGTSSGPFSETKSLEERDQWLFALASLLRHDDYAVTGTGIVPGRRGEATLINVRMRFGQREAVVPYTLVQTERWGWLVEKVDVERITMPPPGRRGPR